MCLTEVVQRKQPLKCSERLSRILTEKWPGCKNWPISHCRECIRVVGKRSIGLEMSTVCKTQAGALGGKFNRKNVMLVQHYAAIARYRLIKIIKLNAAKLFSGIKGYNKYCSFVIWAKGKCIKLQPIATSRKHYTIQSFNTCLTHHSPLTKKNLQRMHCFNGLV